MSPETLQIAVLIATGAIAVGVPLLILLLASRIRNAAHESTQIALTHAKRQHDQSLAEFTRQYDKSLQELARQQDRAVTGLTRQHERAIAELSAEHQRIASEFSVFSQKRHAVYARLYARYRRATHDLAAVLTGQEPEFQKFSRDDLFGYLKRRNLRERDAADAIASMDRGDLFAMNKLMSKLHWRVTLRDASAAFDRAREFEALNELYMSDAVRDAVGGVRRKVEALTVSLMREQERANQATRLAKQDELHAAVASLLHAMRDDLRFADPSVRPQPRAQIDRTPPRPALPAPTQLADRAAPEPAV